ncbi:MAG: sulfurtransferase, partial [Microvirgula sp.]
VINGITYRDSSGSATGGSRVVTLTGVQDNGGTSNGGIDITSLAVASSIMVGAVPVVGVSGGSSAFTAGDNMASTPVAVDGGITVTDTASSTLVSATVSITGNFHAGEDILAFSNGNSSLYGNIVASYNSSTGVLTLSSSGGSATLAQWQAALRAVTYTDSAVTPNTATRTISFQVSDGSASSATVSRTLTVTAVDQTPVATGSGGSAAFTAGDNTASTPVAVDSGITVSDLDNSTLASATVSISGNFQSGQDVLAFSNTSASTFGNIVASYNSGTGVLTLTSSGATATLAQWQAALRAVTYTDSAVTPNTATRTISFQVSDGSKSSAVVSRSVTVAAVDQTPVASTSGGSAAFTAGDNTASTPVVVDGGITVSD